MEIYTWPCAPPPPPPHHATPHTIISHAFHKLAFFLKKKKTASPRRGQFRLQITVEWVNKKNAPKPICTLTKSDFFPCNTPPHHTAVVKEGREGTGESDVRRGRWVCVRGDGGDEGEGREGEEWGGVERRGKDQMKHCSRRQLFGNSEISFPWWACGLTSVKRFP